MKRPFLATVACLMLLFWMPFSEAAANPDPPKVIATTPQNGATAVDPATNTITVTFNRSMKDKSWSWGYEDKNSFPHVTGDPYYSDNGTTCVLPVRLEAGTRYVIKINSVKHKRFKDTQGNAAEPYQLTFTTTPK